MQLSAADMKLLKSTKFPPEFEEKVDTTKVQMDIMKKWIATKVQQILETDDDMVVDFIYNLLDGERYPDPKKLQIALGGFLHDDAPRFVREFWNLCLSAQSNKDTLGVPRELLEMKKDEMKQDKKAQEKAAEEARTDLVAGVAVVDAVALHTHTVLDAPAPARHRLTAVAMMNSAVRLPLSLSLCNASTPSPSPFIQPLSVPFYQSSS
ncbi:Pwi domain mRNA processing protein [Lasiodiplodia theobromae]|uniref:Pwi domain mRNA processing protein n=1 Tax=Lasiodiplodia theobromae TaxID=45133 RepID=UPI0015C35DA2|nr:Pwi domain mRNA processing protein [Lasiodiplodia theobromae]KAF4538347.1 Pwi domain mRNA processing protein [Lasiodiplodia theobromae]